MRAFGTGSSIVETNSSGRQEENMRSSLGRLAAAVGMILATLLASATPVQAADRAPQPAAAVRSVAPSVDLAGLPCWVTPKPGMAAAYVFKSPTSIPPPVGALAAGRRADAACAVTSGYIYTGCGGTSNYWVRIIWAGLSRYVAQLCVSWRYD
jgi:hypothetical protein